MFLQVPPSPKCSLLESEANVTVPGALPPLLHCHRFSGLQSGQSGFLVCVTIVTSLCLKALMGQL